MYCTKNTMSASHVTTFQLCTAWFIIRQFSKNISLAKLAVFMDRFAGVLFQHFCHYLCKVSCLADKSMCFSTSLPVDVPITSPIMGTCSGFLHRWYTFSKRVHMLGHLQSHLCNVSAGTGSPGVSHAAVSAAPAAGIWCFSPHSPPALPVHSCPSKPVAALQGQMGK